MEAHSDIESESRHLVRALLERHRRNSSPGDGGSLGANANWEASEGFTADAGKRQIGEYIRSWGLQPRWLCALDYIYTTEHDYFTFYHYRARFSTPTAQRPIPGTASVYFAVAVSKVKPQTLPVMLYVVESGRLVRAPGDGAFREKWLADVIESKTLLRRELDF